MDLRELQADYSAEYLTAQYELKQKKRYGIRRR